MGEFIHELRQKALNFTGIFDKTVGFLEEVHIKIIPSNREWNSASNTTKFNVNKNL